MATVTNFDRLSALREEAARAGTGSRRWIEFASTMFDAFPGLYATARKMNEEMAMLRTMARRVNDRAVMGDFLGTWIDASKELPDCDTTVLVCSRKNAEPVWLGYHDGECWLSVDGTPLEVTCWSDVPEPAGAPA